MDGLEEDFDASIEEDCKLWKEWKAKVLSDNQDSSALAAIEAVLGLKEDASALATLFEREPHHHLVSGTALMRAICGFGDASGSGFGGSWKKQCAVKYRFGL